MLILGPVALLGSATPDHLAASRAYHNARYLLTAAATAPIAATKTFGDLSPAFVHQALEAMHWPDAADEPVRFVIRAPTERDLPRLHRLRLALERAGLLRTYRDAFHVTAAGRALLAPGQEGELYLALVAAWFALPEPVAAHEVAAAPFVRGLAHLLWRLLAADDQPLGGERLLEAVTAPADAAQDAQKELPPSSATLRRDVLDPLEELGLIRIEWVPGGEETPFDDEPLVRATPLLAQFVVPAARLN